jgi:phosphoenolpyruvate synthase/pyruvate phosphate dikinase
MFIKDEESNKTISRQIPIGKRNSQVLEERFIKIISDLAARAERLFKTTQKFEWAFSKEKFYFLGSKPMK